MMVRILLTINLSIMLINDHSTLSKASFQSPPIELHDIGYHGTWDQFCDPELIEEDFAFYAQHELKLLRLVICERKEKNQINCRSMGPFTAYKYCEIMRTQAENILERLIGRFSHDDEEKKTKLFSTPTHVLNETICYEASWKFFNKTCVDEQNPYFRMYLPLLARACIAEWLTTDQIESHIEGVCSDVTRLTGDIEWGPIAASIGCRE